MPLQHRMHAGAADEPSKVGLFRRADAADRASIGFGFVVVLHPQSLSSAGGGGTRNCDGLVIVQGVTKRIHGVAAGKKPGGVGCQMPGPGGGGVQPVPAFRPSLALKRKDTGRSLLAYGDAVEFSFVVSRYGV